MWATIGSTSPRDRSARIASPKAPTPGQDDPFGLRHDLRVVGDPGRGSEPLERLLHAPQVAAAVIDDRHHVDAV